MSTAGGGGGGRRVTIRSISCRGVKAFVPFQKPPLYAAVSLAGRREKTSGDPDGGENPDWDAAVFAFDLPAAADGMLQFEVKAQVPLLGSKLVGKVSVPLADLAVACGDGAAAAPRHVSYQGVRPRRQGERQAQLHLRRHRRRRVPAAAGGSSNSNLLLLLRATADVDDDDDVGCAVSASGDGKLPAAAIAVRDTVSFTVPTAAAEQLPSSSTAAAAAASRDAKLRTKQQLPAAASSVAVHRRLPAATTEQLLPATAGRLPGAQFPLSDEHLPATAAAGVSLIAVSTTTAKIGAMLRSLGGPCAAVVHVAASAAARRAVLPPAGGVVAGSRSGGSAVQLVPPTRDSLLVDDEFC
ncbi:hypothetical protein OsJ_34132 [Oryza sativa Japonica Group]|uniref:C2 domain-containing protein n=1 Tax=Oryza sativa subsp. japonica TaxID=39947 RepID=A3CBZ4_ORYSJ|nr:hypothetical protein OsJ_34132 [Oryza sativa Japonica Group]